MADPHIQFDVEGLGIIEAFISHRADRARDHAKNLVDDLAQQAEGWLRIYVHYYSGYTFRHIHRTHARWRPGGVGGGGEYEAIAGIKAGTSRHPIYASSGTGIYVGRGLIKPVTGKVLTFQKKGEPRRFRRWVRGQPPQPFLYFAFRQTKLYADTAMARFARGLAL